MVVGAFPAVKLAVLAFKQLSKPIANVLKNRAKQNPLFRRYVCMPPAQFYNWVEVQTKMWALNMGRPTTIPQLNETMAIELGANLLGEVIIFSIGAGLLIWEYIRQQNKESAKEQLLLDEKQRLNDTINELAFQMERHDAQIRELTRIVANLDKRKFLSNVFKSESKETPPPSPPTITVSHIANTNVKSDHNINSQSYQIDKTLVSDHGSTSRRP